jgi:serine/threonine-protein kinase
VVGALHGAGIEAVSVDGADEALAMFADFEPTVLLTELEMPGRDGLWLLRRLREECKALRPRIVVVMREEAVIGRLADLGVDAVVLKPVPPRALLCAVTCNRGPLDILSGDADRLRELVRMSLLQGEMDAAFTALAQRLAQSFRTRECVVIGAVSDRHWLGAAHGPIDDTPEAPLWDQCRVSLEAGAPLFVATGDETLGTVLALSIEAPGGTRIGVIVLEDDSVRLFSLEVVELLRALGQRLYGEIAWRSVHERIAADRDRLRESSMLDPMLGIWTRAALDQAITAEVSACHRRGEPMSVGMVNVRGMRHTNERYGHVVGDAVLRHVADLVRQAVRTQDLVARYMGDAFALVLAGTTLEDARAVLERLQATVAATPLVLSETRLTIAIVASVTPLLGDQDSGEAALVRAAGGIHLARRRHIPLYVVQENALEEATDLSALALFGLEAGTTLGGMYQILHEISRGAMGVVYRAEDLGLGRPVALKTLRPDLARDTSFVERFRTEAATLAALHHVNLVQVYTFGQDGDDVYFVMELVEGEPLEERTQSARREGTYLPLDLVDRVIGEIGNALDTMHQAGILHRDVKPANVLLDRVRDRAVLVDVGIAKKRGTDHDPAGTPGFTAPETFGGAPEGPASDVYGLAATAYQLLTLSQPFGEGGVDEILARQRSERPRPAAELRPGLPDAADLVLLRALDPDPSLRYGSASQFASALAAALREASPHVRAGLRPAPDGAATPQPAHASTLEAWGGLAALAGKSSAADAEVLASLAPASTPPTRILSSPAGRAPKGSVSLIPGAVAANLVASSARLPPLRELEPLPSSPHTRGVLFRSAFRVLGARHGAPWVAHVSRKDPALALALQPQSTFLSWHPTQVFVTMLHAIAESGRDARRFAEELGRVATSVTFSRFFGADPTALSPWQVISAADLFWRRYHTWGEVAVERTGSRHAEITIGAGPKDVLVCAATVGLLEQVGLLSGAAEVHVEHTACEATGAPACRFVLEWQPRVPT